MRFSSPVSAAVLFMALTACVAYGPGVVKLGDAEVTVVRSMGAPAARYALPGGATRLVYARGPQGKHTYMVDLGEDGRVSAVNQVLGEKQFAELPMGITDEELLLRIGPPAERRPLGIKPGTVWSYRYETFECRWFQVTLGPDQRVQEGSYAVDPMCEVRYRDR